MAQKQPLKEIIMSSLFLNMLLTEFWPDNVDILEVLRKAFQTFEVLLDEQIK